MSDSERDRMAEVLIEHADQWPAETVADALIAAGFGDVTSIVRHVAIKRIADLTTERDLAREDCGHQKAMRKSIRDELNNFVRIKAKVTAERDVLAAKVAAVEALVATWPDYDGSNREQLLAVMERAGQELT